MILDVSAASFAIGRFYSTEQKGEFSKESELISARTLWLVASTLGKKFKNSFRAGVLRSDKRCRLPYE